METCSPFLTSMHAHINLWNNIFLCDTSRIELLLPAVERSCPVSRPRHAVTELQGHGGRSGVRSVVGQGVVLAVVLGGRGVVVAGPSSHQTARAHPVHQGVALRELLVHPAAPVVVWRSAVTVVTLRFLPGRSNYQFYQHFSKTQPFPPT